MTAKLTIRPLTPDLWPALEDLFDNKGPCGRCSCMWGRIGAAYRRRPREKNKAAFQAIVKRGPPPGLLAFDGDLAVGWCQLTPRDDERGNEVELFGRRSLVEVAQITGNKLHVLQSCVVEVFGRQPAALKRFTQRDQEVLPPVSSDA
jgi:hypothetical protein